MHLGLDCSTQSFSALIIDAQKGSIAHEASVNFEKDLPHYKTTSGFVHGDQPGEVFSDPLMWVEALDLLMTRLVDSGVDLSCIEAISGSGQQHATVYLNEQINAALASLDHSKDLKQQIAPCLSRPLSPIWMDSSTNTECSEIATAMGGDTEVCRRTGSITIQRFSGPQIRRFAKQSPDAWEQTALVHLNSSFFASIFAGKSVSIDHGDGAGMNLMNLSAGDWDADALKATAADLHDKLPPLAPSATVTGEISPYFVKKYGFSAATKVLLWSGDNPCSLLGMGASTPGHPVVSLGTSYTMFAAMSEPLTDPQGFGHVFGNPSGGFMSLTCFQNGALACEMLKDRQAIDWQEFNRLASLPPSLNDSPSLPFALAETCPLAPASTQENSSVRSLLDGQFLSMKKHTAWMKLQPKTIRVTGGVSQSDGVCQTIANIFNCAVERLETNAAAALGAALQAARATTDLSLDELEQAFCRATGSSISPQAETSPTYQSMAATFDSLLEKHLDH